MTGDTISLLRHTSIGPIAILHWMPIGFLYARWAGNLFQTLNSSEERRKKTTRNRSTNGLQVHVVQPGLIRDKKQSNRHELPSNKRSRKSPLRNLGTMVQIDVIRLSGAWRIAEIASRRGMEKNAENILGGRRDAAMLIPIRAEGISLHIL